MQQVLQSLRSGVVELAGVPSPTGGPGLVLIRSRASLISAGTERMLIEFGKANWVAKTRSQPDKVRMVIEKVRTDGLVATLDSVRAKLDQPVLPGYSNAGVVIEGDGFRPGERVISNGKHAEVVQVPKNLCARIPDGVSDEAAAFTVVSAIALQGIRLTKPELGETFAVMGLGLIGQITVQLLRAQGCRVVGIDPDERRVALARQFGAEAAVEGAELDGVLITAATKSNEPMHQAAQMCRKRGRIVLVGVAGLQLSRDDFYKKELTFQVSCSYGPGRYDPEYEERGHDYPVGYVRWTEQRNFEAVLEIMASGRLDVGPLISHRFQFADAGKAYELLEGTEPYLGVLLEYPNGAAVDRVVALTKLAESQLQSRLPAPHGIGVIGAGAYAAKVLLPGLRGAGARLETIVSSGGANAAYYGRKFGFAKAASDAEEVVGDPEIGAVVIATPHATHADLVCRALEAGKHVFVEKPLALTDEEIDRIQAAYRPGLILMVGFNRRFAPQVQKMKALLGSVHSPKSFVMTVNAGVAPGSYRERIIGEGCHFVDLLRFLAGSPLVKTDGMTRLQFADGSSGAIHYLVHGHKSFPKERLEVFCAGRVLQLDNFRRLTGFGWPGFSKMNLWRQDKGNAAGVAAFVEAVREGKESPIPFGELIEVARATVCISKQSGT